jgi:O-6-methylguanine DNA methyltransferase
MPSGAAIRDAHSVAAHPFSLLGIGTRFLRFFFEGVDIVRVERADAHEGACLSTLHPPLAESLEAFMRGVKIKRWPVVLRPQGTEFQLRVWEHLSAIPYGETISYRTLAERAGNEAAMRAAAQACARNPMPILVPCHRVIASDGALRGFAWGMEWKRALLQREGNTPDASAPRLRRAG